MDKLYLQMFANISTLNNANTISDEALKQFEKNLKSYLNSDDDSDSSGDSSISLGTISIVASGANERIIALLYKLHKNCKNAAQKRKLSNLIKNLNDCLEEAKNNYYDKQPQFIEEKTSTIIDKSAPSVEIERKLNNYSLFALNKSINESYFPTKDVTIDTSALANFSRAELINLFTAENFYNLSSSQVMALLQAVSNDYLTQNNVSCCAVGAEDLKFDDNSIIFGEYDPNLGAIQLNKNVLQLFEIAKTSKDQYFPYQLLSTLIHEADHRVQFSKLGKTNLSTKENLICSALRAPNGNTYSEYLSSLDELDARNASLEYIRNLALETNSEPLKQFYNQKKKEEINNHKKAVPDSTKALFRDIYDEKFLTTTKHQILSRSSFRKIITEALNDEQSL